MVDFILIALFITFLVFTFLLRNIARSEEGQIRIGASLSPEPNVSAVPIPTPSQLKLLIEIPAAVVISIIIVVISIIIVVISIIIVVILAIVRVLSAFRPMLLHGDLKPQKRETRHSLRTPLPGYTGGCRYDGNGRFPKKVYEGDSRNVTISLRPSFYLPKRDGEPLIVHDTREGKSITLQFLRGTGDKEYLEIELLTAGFSTEGEKKQRRLLNSNALEYQWNCYFPNSGNHALGLAIRLISPPNELQIGFIEHSVRVAKLDHLTKRQVWILASLTGIITGGLAIAETLHGFGL